LFFSLLQLGYFQTWLLYHNALSSGVEIDDILKHARRSKDVVGELRAQVAEQQELIRSLISSRGDGNSTGEGLSTGASAGGREAELVPLLKRSPGAATSNPPTINGRASPPTVAAPVPSYGSTMPPRPTSARSTPAQSVRPGCCNRASHNLILV
jgi:hypothetical protein